MTTSWAVLILIAAALGPSHAAEGGFSEDLPAEAGGDISAERESPYGWLKVRFRDEWGLSRSGWVRRDHTSYLVSESRRYKPFPVYYLQDIEPPPGAASDGAVVYKRAVLSAWELTRDEGKGEKSFTAASPGASFKSKAAFSYGFDEGVEWVVLRPKKRELLGDSPFSDIGAWPACRLMVDAKVKEKLHPAELDLAGTEASYARYAPSKDHEDALGGGADGEAEAPYLAVQGLRAKVYPKAAAEVNKKLSGRPESRFTPFEAAFLHCRMDRVVDGIASSSRSKFYEDLKAAKDLKAFVEGWRGFIRAEVSAYVEAVKGLPGAAETDTPWEGYDGFDAEALRAAAKARTEEAVASGGKPPAKAAPKRTVTAKRSRKVVETAGEWLEDLSR